MQMRGFTDGDARVSWGLSGMCVRVDECSGSRPECSGCCNLVCTPVSRPAHICNDREG